MIARPAARAGRTAVTALLFAAASAVAAFAADPADLRAIFPREADVIVPAAGLVRLTLPAEVVTSCRSDLSDLRLFDRDGKEIPFLVESRRAADTLVVSRRVVAKVLSVQREELRRTTGPPIFRETYELRMPAPLPPAEAWELAADIARTRFVARLQIDAIGSGGGTTSLVRNGSLFRLSGPRSPYRVRFALPSFTGESVRITLDSEEGAFLDPSFRFESARRLEGSGGIAVALEILEQESRDGTTRIEVGRPRGLVPELLRIGSATDTFDRAVVVNDEGPGREADRLGGGQVWRVQAVVPVEELEIPLRAARGDRLRLEIDDGDSPPLREIRLEAVLRKPVIVFSAPPGGGPAGVAVLRFGGGRARAPRYDLAGFRLPPGEVAVGERARALERIHDLAALPEATLGPVRANPSYDNTPALSFAMRPGAVLDPKHYRHRRTLRVTPSPEGLSRLRLSSSDLAVLRDDLADLRVADGEGRQWPYLLERDSGIELVELGTTGPASRDHRSLYRLQPPHTPVSVDRILLDTDAPFFDRPVTVSARAGRGDPWIVFSGRLVREARDPRPIALDLSSTARLDELEVAIADGDDAPLVLRAARGRVLVPDLFVAASAGEYSLLMGAPEESAPIYELSRARDVVLAVGASPIAAAELLPNPDFSAPAPWAGKARQTFILWAVLGLAVVTLAVLTFRLARP